MNSNQDPGLEYFRLLFDESHRGCVILVAEKLNETLKELHLSHINSLASPSDSLLKKLRKTLTPHASFSTRIRLGHKHGLVEKETYDDLEWVRKLRNTAAHSTTVFSFRSSAVRDRVHALQAPNRAAKNFFVTEQERQAVVAPDNTERTTKLYFLLAGMCLNIEILTATQTALERSNSFPP